MSVNETDDLTELRLWLVRLVVGFIGLVVFAGLPFLLLSLLIRKQSRQGACDCYNK
jgi:hypothetical protein